MPVVAAEAGVAAGVMPDRVAGYSLAAMRLDQVLPGRRRPLALPAATSRSRDWRTTTGSPVRGRCSSACPDSRVTAMISRLTRSRVGPRRWSCSGRWTCRSRRSGSTTCVRRWRPRRRPSTAIRPRDLDVVGVTGTNGKTTTAFLLRALLEAGGRRTGLLGTVKSVVGGVEHEVQRTTPEAIDLQRTFAEMRAAGDSACVMEVSSHALALHRADAIHFAAAVFTNLTQDHLDFHPTMEDYFAAKRLLFAGESPACGPRGRRSSTSTTRTGRGWRPSCDDVTTFALRRRRRLPGRRRSRPAWTGRGSPCTRPTARSSFARRCAAAFNVYNVIGALATARALGIDAATCVEAIATAGQVPGRFETVDEGQPFAVLVDYAHTPDSLENVLRAARGLTRGAPAGRVRLRRRPRSGQAPADGGDRPPARRRRDRHLRQPAIRGSGGDHRRDPRGLGRGSGPRPRPPRRDRTGDRIGAGRATSS